MLKNDKQKYSAVVCGLWSVVKRNRFKKKLTTDHRSLTTIFVLMLQFFLASLLLTQAASAQAICPLNGKPLDPKGVRSLDNLKNVAILDNGRIKPLDTYARNLLLPFSGKSTINGQGAMEWFARLLFAPDSTHKDKIFLINNPAIANSLGIKVEEKRLYSMKEIEPAVAKLE